MKIALVTGAAKGIGRAIAVALARDGFGVAVHYRSSQTQAESAVAEIRAAGGCAEAFQAELTDPAQVDALVKAVEQRLGPLHTLVSNAGILKGNLIALTSFAEWREVLASNLDAAFLLTKAVARPLARRREGRIIYISSDAGLLGDLMRAAYSASKAGLLGLSKTAARELANSRVTVNAIAPGIVATDMTADIPESRRAKQMAAIPMERLGAPEDVAGVARFLASDEAAWITGQVLCVDGGLCMHA